MLTATPEIALKYLEVALEYNELREFICCDLDYALVAKDMYGQTDRMYCYYAGALYNKYSKKDIEDFDKKVFDAFVVALSRRDYHSLHNALEVLKHMLLCEKYGTATFKLDMTSLFWILRKNILENTKRYYKVTEPDKPPLIVYLRSYIVEVHHITGEWIIPKKLQKSIKL